MTDRLDRLVERLRGASRRLSILCGGALVALSVLVGAEVVLRKLFSASLQGADEIAGYTLAVVAAVAFTRSLFERAHIRIDAFHRLFPARLRALLDLVALASLLFFFAVVLRFGWALFARSVELEARSMTPLAVPLWLPQGLWTLGLAFFVLCATLLLARALIPFVAGRLGEVSALVGLADAEEAKAPGDLKTEARP